jgi:hypothetical protein
MQYESGFSGVFVYPKLTCTYSYLICQTSDEAHDNPDTYFSDPVDIASSDAESFDEDDMYGLDYSMEVVSESSDDEGEVEISESTEERMVCRCRLLT